MSNKRSRQMASPDQLYNNNSNNNKKQQTQQTMANKTTSPDVFSWDKLCEVLDIKLQNVAKKDDLLLIQNEMEELRAENRKLRKEINDLTTRLEYIDRKTRSNNIVVSGLSCKNVPSAKTEFNRLCSEVLSVNTKVIAARPIPKNNAFCFTLESHLQTNSVIAAKSKLKGKSIYVQRDYTREEQNMRYAIRQMNKHISNRYKNIKIRLGDLCTYIDDKKYTWSMGKAVAYTKSDAVYLQNLLTSINSTIEVTVKNGNIDETNNNNSNNVSSQ